MLDRYMARAKQHSSPDPRAYSFGATAGDEDARELLQRRLAAWFRTLILAWVFVYPAFLYQYLQAPDSQDLDTQHALNAAGASLCVLLWLLLRGRARCSMRVLRFIDAFAMIGVGAGHAAVLYLNREALFPPGWVTFAVVTLGIMARALFVPSSGRRTFIVSILTLVLWSTGLAALAISHPDTLNSPLTIELPLFAVLAVAVTSIAAFGSSVIYGLRKQVREAMRLGQYTLGEKIGEGGMGVVYRGTHAMLRRPTAIKLLSPDKTGRLDLVRFEREVQLTGELSHPNTVVIYDYGRSEDGIFYYAMEYLDGVDLESLVRRDGAQPAGRVVRILAQVCGALGEAHERGLIHRDIKPANIVLCNRGNRPDVAKVVDFGLVKDLESVSDATAEGAIAGTPKYLSPETITNPESVGPPSDLYALGAVGYFLLTAKSVFEGRTVAEVCAHHLHTEPVPPSQQTDIDAPNALEELILQCLAKDAADRPASADSLGAALLALPVASAWTDDHARAWWQQHEADEPAADRSPRDAAGVMTVEFHGRKQE